MIKNQELIDLLNEQIGIELESSNTYLALAGWFEQTPWKGFAARYRAAALEEHMHAMKFFDFLADRDAPILIHAIPQPKQDHGSVLEAAKAVLEQERYVSSKIHKLYAAAEQAGDYETKHFLHWFLDEQIEEEKTAKDFLEYVEAAGESPAALLMLDQKMGPGAASPGE